ncbi:MAG TPA: C4-type zinc ribbon domain-containing protein [Micromonosporaceae bacterium]|nr:C4-type zinc ribbon domain-containing protein [Micromonosporaceae bacterium]
MKADPDAQRRLLDLQGLDTGLAQLAHRRRSMPEHAESDRLARSIAALDDEHVRAQVSIDDLDRDIARLERDIDQVRARKAKDQARLDAGTGPARELEALQHEMVSLSRRQTDLEDAELELMEQREQAEAVLREVDLRRSAARAERDTVESRRAALLSDIARDEEFKLAARKPLVADLPPDLISLYEKIRELTGGIGAALLRAGQCEGCRLELSGSERARVRAAPPDEVLRCDECRRILVRTPESGL